MLWHKTIKVRKISPEIAQSTKRSDTKYRKRKWEDIMQNLIEKIHNCKKCEWLNCKSNKTLSSPWYGNIKSKAIFYWSSVGWSGEERVIPFASGSGRLLDKIFALANIKKEDIYLSNAVKCRLPNLRSPKDSELENCKSHILEEIKIIKPEIIVPMWSFATKTFLWNFWKLEDVVYKEFVFQWIKIIPMFHPAYIMRWIWDKNKYINKMIELFTLNRQ